MSPLAQRLLVLTVIAGFPLALVLSWLFDITPQGIVRTGDLPASAVPAPVQAPQPESVAESPLPLKPPQYEFGDFCVDSARRALLRRDGQPLPLTPRVFDTLLYLIQHAGSVLGKDQLMAAIWSGRVVEENNLSQNISTLRRVLGDGEGGSRYILTVPGQGYRFVGDVREVGQLPAPSAGSATPAVVAGAAPSRTRKLSASRLAATVVLVAAFIIIVVAIRPWHRPAPTVTATPTRTIAVLPFKSLLAEARDDALDLGMTDMLIAKLSNSHELVVRSLSAVRRYGGQTQDPLAAGRELGVESVLDGSFQRWGDRIRVTARLVQVRDGSALWAGSFDEKFTDVFSVQDAISQRVAASLALRLSGDERKGLAKRYTENIEAYQLYLTGRTHIDNLTHSEILKGIDFLQRAIALDPNYALAYAAIADAYRRLPINSDMRPEEAFPKAEAAAEKALALDDSIALTHVALGFTRMWYDWRWADAEREFKRAIELNPSDALAHLGNSVLLTNLGRNDEAILEARRALELDPMSLIVKSVAAWSLDHGGRDDEAVASLRKAFDINPDFWLAHVQMSRILLRQGKYAEAIAELNQAKRFSEGDGGIITELGIAWAKAGDLAKTRAALDELQALSSRQYVPPSNFAGLYAALGQLDQAFTALDRAYAERDAEMAFLGNWEAADSLRADPRYAVLLKRMNLDQAVR
ncbi:winged helix-turn-helix domain-containing tetratricopeptide repeat protein [Nevskia soli]|uniref:winged helix-turn-helix domain-containing tetratricopeptide repeat protein n=1 Tax=Nevskia soli TaxID=418856 RepID=UPI00146FCB2B|nr:winged helix-turn-helix domain-containing protein [Nevskia soli]